VTLSEAVGLGDTSIEVLEEFANEDNCRRIHQKIKKLTDDR
jgi:hypothetical protein